MASAQPDPNGFTVPFQLTKGMHRDIYGSVKPDNPELSASSKVVIITGASGGLGHKTALAWSTAGAAGIVLVGRGVGGLEATAKDLTVPYLVASGDVSAPGDAQAILDKAVAQFGRVDALVNAHGHMNDPDTALTGKIDPTLWWEDFEVNVRGVYNMCHAFINATGGKGTVVNLVSLAAGSSAPGLSAYGSSKLAVIKLGELLHLEHPELRVFSVHPGIVAAEGGRGGVVRQFDAFAIDKPMLTGAVTLWLAQARADFLRGGYLSVNWDLEELEAHKAEIVEKKLLQLAFINGKIQPGGHPWDEK